MYLSEYMMDARLAVNPYEVHRHLWKAFPDMPEADRPFLFRREIYRRGTLRVLMLSSVEPSGGSLSGGCSLLRVREFNPSLREGQSLRFMLHANPVKCLSGERCRVPLIREDEQVEWLRRKLAPGAELVEAVPVGKEAMYFKKRGMGGKVVAVTFTGVLRISSPSGMMDIIRSGVGPAKSFGCGMLTVARA
jgi:CRISPR system Cascade subunit CasE